MSAGPSAVASDSSGGAPKPYYLSDAADIDGLAAGLIYLQATAYAKDCHFAHAEQWCEQVWFLNEFLQARKHGSLKEAARIVESLVAYEP